MADQVVKEEKLQDKLNDLGTSLGWFEDSIDVVISQTEKEIQASCIEKRTCQSDADHIDNDQICDSDNALRFDSSISPLRPTSSTDYGSCVRNGDTEKQRNNDLSSTSPYNRVYLLDDEDDKEKIKHHDDIITQETNHASQSPTHPSENDVSYELYQSLTEVQEDKDQNQQVVVSDDESQDESYHSFTENDDQQAQVSITNKEINISSENSTNNQSITDNNYQGNDDDSASNSLYGSNTSNQLYQPLTDNNDINNVSSELYNISNSNNDQQAQSLDDHETPSYNNSSLAAQQKSCFIDGKRVLQMKYNPEESPGCDDFESFLDSVRTPKQPQWKDSPELDNDDVQDFIVDDDCFVEEEENDFEDVFVIDDDSDDDKENFKTPLTFTTPGLEQATKCVETFKTPWTEYKPKPAKATGNPSTDSFKTPLTDIKLKRAKPLSSIECIITPYSTTKEFKKKRDVVVKELFQLYNSTIFENKLPSDFSITWNNKMRSTAGYCYYGRKNGVNTSRIELADKVIDSAGRLRDTLVHEMCHAAAWLINGVRAGHGPVWKKWASRANFIHQDLPAISRCHSYKINTKYIYQCTNEFCSNSVGRHSKSLDLEKYRCSYCKSRFELQPQLKKDGTPQSSRAPNKFAMFVKDHYGKVKKSGMTHKEVMKELSSQFSSLSTK